MTAGAVPFWFMQIQNKDYAQTWDKKDFRQGLHCATSTKGYWLCMQNSPTHSVASAKFCNNYLAHPVFWLITLMLFTNTFTGNLQQDNP